MFRILLAISMIVQVVACPLQCRGEAAPAEDAVQSKSHCSCCSTEPTPHSPSLPDPCDEDQDGDCCICFCNTQVTTASPLTLADDSACEGIALIEALIGTGSTALLIDHSWPPGNHSGKSVRLAVQSLLL